MTAQPEPRLTVQQYFELDRQSDAKLEYYAGVVVAQAGSTARHNLIVSNLIGHLYAPLRQRGCRVFPSDMRVQAIDQHVYTYPDLTIVCGPPQYAEPSELTLINPTVIIEILSPSTETRDRREKLEHYRAITSLQEYVLVAQHLPYIQRYQRQTPHFWYVHITDDLAGTLTLASVATTLAVSAVYDGIVF